MDVRLRNGTASTHCMFGPRGWITYVKVVQTLVSFPSSCMAFSLFVAALPSCCWLDCAPAQQFSLPHQHMKLKAPGSPRYYSSTHCPPARGSARLAFKKLRTASCACIVSSVYSALEVSLHHPQIMGQSTQKAHTPDSQHQRKKNERETNTMPLSKQQWQFAHAIIHGSICNMS